MVSSISYSLGIGSGIDTKALIDGLADAVRAPKEAQLARREAANAAQVSALADASGAIDSFAAALSTLIAGGTLFSQPNVSDTSILTATAQPGARLGDLSAVIEVGQLARAQTLESMSLASASDPVGQGDLTLTTSRGAFTVTIDATNDSLDGLAKAINDQNSGVTASIVTQQGGARLVLKGGTGEAEAFTLGVPAGTATGLERFAFGGGATGGMTAAQTAQDAIVHLDGVEVKRSSNVIADLIDGIQIDLKRAVPGTTVSLGITRPSAAIEQAVNDFTAAYNELHAILAEATARPGAAGDDGGPLRGDLGIRELQRQLARLPSTVLSSQGGPATLAEIGVATNRDGTLSVNGARLKEMLEADPQGVEALFNPGQYSSSPLVSIMSKMGKAKPGTYQLTELVPAAGGVGATGKVDGLAMISSGTNLIAPVGSGAIGLVVKLSGSVSSATITIDSGIGGALQAIRDAVRASTGPFASAQDRLAEEAETIAEDRETLETRSETYYNQLVSSFTAMERRVSAFKATQSYLEQQIKAWNASGD
ncbi:flagellar filament capping protein FliD [Enterovirga sp. GCM10030262]|uniref:flagellar filament capping protein FliD n=1 Tax=Enterovirga sp. GCM10030262 TaxID=3273391 RepID=UPI00361C94DE